MFNTCISINFVRSIDDFDVISSFRRQLQNSFLDLSVSKENECLSKGSRQKVAFYFIEYKQFI